MAERLRIGLIGWGTVGAAFGELLATGPLPVELARLAVSDPARKRASALPPGVEIGLPGELAQDPELAVVVELAGGADAALPWARATLERGAAYVTANKALLATHGGELATLARRSTAARSSHLPAWVAERP